MLPVQSFWGAQNLPVTLQQCSPECWNSLLVCSSQILDQRCDGMIFFYWIDFCNTSVLNIFVCFTTFLCVYFSERSADIRRKSFNSRIRTHLLHLEECEENYFIYLFFLRFPLAILFMNLGTIDFWEQ